MVLSEVVHTIATELVVDDVVMVEFEVLDVDIEIVETAELDDTRWLDEALIIVGLMMGCEVWVES